jgi:hypothetical protein
VKKQQSTPTNATIPLTLQADRGVPMQRSRRPQHALPRPHTHTYSVSRLASMGVFHCMTIIVVRHDAIINRKRNRIGTLRKLFQHIKYY